jgi:hypothetical protein
MKVNYLAKYGTRRYQGGGGMPAPGGAEGGMPAEGGAPPEGGMPEGGAPPEGGQGGDPQAEIMALAQAAAQGDQAAAAQLGMALAPMILEQAQGGAQGGPEGGAPAPAEGGAPVFRRGGRLA